MIGSRALTQKAKLLYALVASAGGSVTLTEDRIQQAIGVGQGSLTSAMIELSENGLMSVEMSGGQLSLRVHVLLEDQEIVKVSTRSENKDEEAPDYVHYLSYLNTLTNKSYKGDKKSRTQFMARIKEGFSLSDFTKAIDNAVASPYHKENLYRWLTPTFFTRADKLDAWLNADTDKGKKKISTSDFGKLNLTNL